MPAFGQGKQERVKASALANQSAVVPGQTVSLLVQLEIPDEMHIYWRSPGGTGLPTTIEWTGPDGVTFGRTRFPAPQLKFDKTLKEDSFVMTGTAMFVTPVTVPDGFDAKDVLFKCKASWLACRKGACVPDGAELTLRLPFAKSAKAENTDTFEEAEWNFPVSAAKAENAKISGSIDVDEAIAGQSFTATITADIAKHMHMQSHKPLEDYLVPAIIFLEPTPGFEFGDVDYPKGKVRNDPLLGKLSEYAGKTNFRVPVKVAKTDDDGKPIGTAPRSIRGVLQYQICNDSGTCFPPQAVEFEIPVKMKGGAKPAKETSAAASTGTETKGPVNEEKDQDEKAAAAPVAANGDDSGEGWLTRSQNYLKSFGYFGVLIMAFLGGMVLNLMPCVLPVISLKVMSFVKQAGEDRGRILALGITYCAGIMSFFSVLATMYYAGGSQWGEHFQRPLVVLILAAVVTAFGLSLFGVFAVFTPKFVNEVGQKAEEREGLPSAYFTGVLATLLGTACTAPFLSASVGAASEFPPLQGAFIFFAVGIGMMLPFLVLSAVPAWLKFVPKPGPWMGTFEAIMGFILLMTVVWILNPIRGQLGDFGLLLALLFLIGVGMSVWLKGKAQFGASGNKKRWLNVAALATLILAWMIPFQLLSTIGKLQASVLRNEELIGLGLIYETQEESGGEKGVAWNTAKQWERSNGEIPWLHYDQNIVREYVESGFPVFVDFTADWCASCKVNLGSSINTDQTKELLRANDIVPFEADYTNRSPKIRKVLKKYGRAGVPLYLVFHPNRPDDPIILPELLSPGIVADALKSASETRMANVQP